MSQLLQALPYEGMSSIHGMCDGSAPIDHIELEEEEEFNVKEIPF
jgi:hypothetical protein